jgi:hypothetical protein
MCTSFMSVDGLALRPACLIFRKGILLTIRCMHNYPLHRFPGTSQLRYLLTSTSPSSLPMCAACLCCRICQHPLFVIIRIDIELMFCPQSFKFATMSSDVSNSSLMPILLRACASTLNDDHSRHKFTNHHPHHTSSEDTPTCCTAQLVHLDVHACASRPFSPPSLKQLPHTYLLDH